MRQTKRHRRQARDRRALAGVAAAVAGLLLLASAWLWLIGAGSRVASGGLGGPFALQQADGRTVTDRDFAGKLLVIYFGYTACRDVCPTTLATIASALDRLGPAARQVQPLFITVDPARDTPDVAQRYAASFAPAIIGLSGSPGALAQVAREYHISSEARAAPSGATGYDIDHSSVIFLVDADRRQVTPVRADDSVTALAKAIGRHLS